MTELWQQVFRYNTLVCLAGVSVLGLSGGVVGTFMLLRKRSLVGDVVGHAALPGVGIAFLVMELARPGSGKFVPGLLAGAALAAALGVVCALGIRSLTRIREDAALAIVLSVFYGAGVVLLSVVQQVGQRPEAGSPTGLKNYIFGMASAIDASDVRLMLATGLAALAACALLFKEFKLLCFDEQFAVAQGWPVTLLDLLLMGLVVMVAVAGMPGAGLLLVVAMLIVPAAAARFWSNDLRRMAVVAAAAGCVSAALAVVLSATYSTLVSLPLIESIITAVVPVSGQPAIRHAEPPTGPLIVLTGSAFFVLSLALGTRRGVLRQWLLHWRLRRRVGRHDLLRAMYELVEQEIKQSKPSRGLAAATEAILAQALSPQRLLAKRSWTPWQLRRLVASAERADLLRRAPDGRVHLTAAGLTEARQIIRNHRLWEMYLITYADVAPGHVDRSADRIEHVLDADIILELENRLAEQYEQPRVPPSPHTIASSGGAP
jgi:manganese/zinc/iron transport system permease protein